MAIKNYMCSASKAPVVVVVAPLFFEALEFFDPSKREGTTKGLRAWLVRRVYLTTLPFGFAFSTGGGRIGTFLTEHPSDQGKMSDEQVLQYRLVSISHHTHQSLKHNN